MTNRRSSVSNMSSVMIAASKFRRLSSPTKEPEGGFQRSSSLQESNVRRQRGPSKESAEIITKYRNVLTDDETEDCSALKKFKTAVKTTIFVLNRRKSDTFLLTKDMFENNRRRGTIHGNHGIQSTRRSADFPYKDIRLGTAISRQIEERKKRLIQKFKIAARVIGCMICLSKKVIHENEFSLTFRGEMKRLSELQANTDGHGQVTCVNRIDTSYYKANTQMRMSAEGKRILSKLPKERTEKEVQYATIALRNVKTIADYPLHIQQQLAKYGFFESYETKRIVVKERRPSENYYILIYGQVMFAKFDEANMAKRLGSLYRGYYFGELGIYNGTPRQSSIITEEYTELLRVSDVDFKRIFMVGDVSRNPEKDMFLRNVIYLKGWPLETLKGNHKAIMTSYFQRDAIMTRDSKMSEWIFIVKSGSIRVMKKLVKTSANTSKRTGIHKKLAHTDGYSAFITNEKEYRRYNLYNDIETPPPLTLDSHISDNFDEYKETPLTLPLMLKLQRACRPHTANADLTSSKERSRRRLSLSWSSGYERQSKKKTFSSVSSVNVLLPSKRLSSKSSNENSLPVEEVKDQGRRTIFDDWDAATKHKTREITEADLNPQFVQVQTLTKGQVFGLQYILYKERQPSFIVMSNGAECVKLSRQVFEENLTFSVKNDLLKMVPPYPTDEYMQDRLVTQMNWECYKDVLVHNLIEERDRQNPDKYCPKYPRIRLK